MTAIIVRFKPPQANKEEPATAEVISVTKKRPMSPNGSAEATECSTEENVIECKRAKTETC